MNYESAWRLCRLFFVCIFIGIFTLGCSSFGGLGSVPSVFVDASGVGASKEAALNEAFREAVQKAVGVLVSSKIVLNDGVITKDVVYEHSSGFVNSYEVLVQEKTSNDLWRVEISALVSSTKLSDQLLGKSTNGTSAKPNTDKMYAQATTVIDARTRGDAFLADLLSDFPNGAYLADMGGPRLVIDNSRNSYLVIPFELKWSKIYLDALRQTVAYVSSDTCSLILRRQKDCDYDIRITSGFMGVNGYTAYKFADSKQQKLLQERIQPKVVVVANFYDKSDKFIFKSCKEFDVSTRFFDGYRTTQMMSSHGLPIEIYDEKSYGQFEIKMHYQEQIKSIGRIDAQVKGSC